MFFKLDIYEKTSEKLVFSEACNIMCEGITYAEFIKDIFSGSVGGNGRPILSVSFIKGFPAKIKKKIPEGFDCPDAYAIEIGKSTKIYSKDERGFIYAMTTLRTLSDSGELFGGFIFDKPMVRERGYRVYLPAREGFESFKRMIDFLAFYKYNSIMLEIGGAMEYERHPEINERWAEFAKETHAYSGRAHEIQRKTYPWKKNSIHTDNAEGDILTKKECRELRDYCLSRGLEVIPECPTLSHCDYLVMAHPEIREREGDEYPDTYCPLHPDTYPLVFDMLEEVIEVFEPERINIGHDEAYSIGVCKRCKKYSAPVLYSQDVNKIHAFLKARGIKTMMWGEKLLNAYHKGEPVGGAGYGKGLSKVNALYPCRDLLPKDVTMLHWYYVFNPEYDKVYHERGMKVIFGNLNALNVEKWDERVRAGIDGGFVSNWGSFGEEYMQRNLQYFSLISTAYAFWCDDFGSLGKDAVLKLTAEESYRKKLARIKNPLTITHTTPHSMKYNCFYDGVFIVDSEYLLGNYVITYSDGTEATLPVKFGTNIGSYEYEDYKNSPSFREVTYSTLPVRYKKGFAYKALYEDPSPDKAIVGIRYLPLDTKKDIPVELISFLKEARTVSMKDVTKEGFAGEGFAWDGGRLKEE